MGRHLVCSIYQSEFNSYTAMSASTAEEASSPREAAPLTPAQILRSLQVHQNLDGLTLNP